MDKVSEEIVRQINEVLGEYRVSGRVHTVGGSPGGVDPQQVKLYTKMSDAIIRFAPPRSAYMANAKTVFAGMESQLQNVHSLPQGLVIKLVGILEGLKDAYAGGYIKTVEELINSELFSDFLEMGNYYLSEGHKDAAAVILGGVLEEHLRKLCQKNGIDTTYTDVRGDIKNKKTSQLNQDLKTGGIYLELQKKQIDAWLDIRNAAAHGHYSEYTKAQVQSMHEGIKNFILSNPA